MKVSLTVFLFFASLILTSCSAWRNSEKENKDTLRLFPSAELRSDLEFLVKNSQEVHPSLYSAVDSITFTSSVKKVMDSLNHSMTRLEFYRLAAPLLSLLKNGHSCIFLPGVEWESYLEHGGRSFPYRVSFDSEGGLKVKESCDSSSRVMPGARIVAINGLEADSLFNAFKTYRGGESEKWQNNVASEWFKRYLWLNKILAPYEITFRANGREMKLKTDGIARSRTPSQPAVTYKEPYTFEMLPGNIGYMNYLSMESNDVSNPFGAFLEKVFSELKAKEASGLIIDLRQNGGGNAKYGYMLLNYLAEKPFRMHSMKAWKASAQYKDYMRSRIPWWLSWVSYRPAIWIAGLFSEYADMFTAKDGEVLKFYTAEEIPEDNPLRFQIKVCFLIGTGTYSSAMLLANAVSDYKLACLIGEETGGIPNEFGEVYYFRLPNTQLMVSMPSALFVRANGNCSDRRGVLPDIEVKRKPMDTERQSDTVLEAARNWILNN